jgi:hypothetical protein
MKRLATLIVLSVFCAAGDARAEMQKSGPEVWPGKVMLGVRPIGFGLTFGGGPGADASYKLGLDFAGRLKEFSKASLWLGFEANIGVRPNLAEFEPGVFVMVTLEKLLKIPLVPLISFGLSGPIYVPFGFRGAYTYGAVHAKLGGGVYYFVTKNVGLGVDLHLGGGLGFFKDSVNRIYYGAQGTFDALAGARFAF